MSAGLSGGTFRADPPIDSIDLNVDAALLLGRLVAEDRYPVVLALMPNIEDVDDQRRVDAVVTEELHEAGIMSNGQVHPVIAEWIRTLCAPERELAVLSAAGGAILRMVLVRRGDQHVLASRFDDSIVVQSFGDSADEMTDASLSAPVLAALGEARVLDVAPVVGPADELTADHPQTLVEWGATAADAARIVAVATAEPLRLTEIHVIEHGRGNRAGAANVIRIVDTDQGRLMMGPSRMSGRTVWATIGPATPARVAAAIGDLIDMLPAGSWREP